ncbi:MAG: single-stranded DNA-binding protein [Puniceicoccales bacterium]|jgi:single-strand DNA-binding protein|nr:single-stranded DNA-binding protein [Puniceicoccales bacterium]
MASYNRVLLMGNFVRDPELRVTPNGLAICRFTIATSRVIRQGDGNTREEVTFVDVEAFGKTGETVAKYFQKGRPIFVEGRLRLNEWQTNTGEKRSKLMVVLESFVFVGSKASNEGMGRESGSRSAELAEGKNEETAYDADREDVPF